MGGGAKSPKFAVSCRAYAAARGVRESNICKILYFMFRIHCGFILECLKGILFLRALYDKVYFCTKPSILSQNAESERIV